LFFAGDIMDMKEMKELVISAIVLAVAFGIAFSGGLFEIFRSFDPIGVLIIDMCGYMHMCMLQCAKERE